MQLIQNAVEGGEYPEKTLAIDGTESLVAIELCKKYNCTLALVPGECQGLGDRMHRRNNLLTVSNVVTLEFPQTMVVNGERFMTTIPEMASWAES